MIFINNNYIKGTYMRINNTTSINPNFSAKFFYSDSLKQVADYAVEKGKFDKLNSARKSIDSRCVTTRIKLEAGLNSKGFAKLVFFKYLPKQGVIIPKTMEDYVLVKTTTYNSNIEKNPLKMALSKIIKMGNNNANNNTFKLIVIDNK
jgi:hypothetical protein